MVEKELGKGRVLVTGITGYIAWRIGEQLLQKGYIVRGSVRSKVSNPKMEALKDLPFQERLEVVEADLCKPETWDAAVSGCNYVMHVASPSTLETFKDESVLTKPAVEGTKAILTACQNHKEVKAVVITSSIATIISADCPDKAFTEDDWVDLESPEGGQVYTKAKTLAEKAAWEMYNSMDKSSRFRLAVIHPALTFGPSGIKQGHALACNVRNLVSEGLKTIPKLFFAIVDVRDVAAAHIAAMENPVSDSKRYICSSGGYLWSEDIARILKVEFEKAGHKVTEEVLKECPVSDKKNFFAIWWGKPYKLSNERIKKDLGITFHTPEETVSTMAQGFVQQGFVSVLTEKH